MYRLCGFWPFSVEIDNGLNFLFFNNGQHKIQYDHALYRIGQASCYWKAKCYFPEIFWFLPLLSCIFQKFRLAACSVRYPSTFFVKTSVDWSCFNMLRQNTLMWMCSLSTYSINFWISQKLSAFSYAGSAQSFQTECHKPERAKWVSSDDLDDRIVL